MRCSKILATLCMIMVICQQNLYCVVRFRDRNSAIVISGGTSFHASRDNFVIDGAFELMPNGGLTGEAVTFDGGRFVEGSSEIVLSASVDLDGAEAIILESGGTLRANNCTVGKDVIVKGTQTRIEGQPTFSSAIVLDGASSRLSLAIQNELNKNINLNGGHLILDGDLKLSDNVFFLLDGVIHLSGHRLELGSTYTFPLDADLDWYQAQDVSLTGSIELQGQWQFLEDATISGNGHVLDLGGGGSLAIGSGKTLALNDLIVSGLDNTSISFGSATSKLLLSNSILKLDAAITTAQGHLYVNSSSTIVLGDNNWYFSSLGKLTVDGASLWLDTLNAWTFPPLGQLHAPDPFYAPYPDYEANSMTNLDSNNFDLLNSGTVKLLHDGFVAYNTYAIRSVSPYIQNILAGNLDGDYTIDQSVHLFVEDVIHASGNATIDGDGESLIFTSSSSAQIVVDQAVTLKFSNIRLSNITANTISLEEGSVLEFGENVTLEFADDVALQNGTIRLAGTSNVCTARGVGGKYVITLVGSFPAFTLDLQGNSLVLENLEIKGLDLIDFVQPGSITLGSDAIININQQTMLNFVISGLGNIVRSEIPAAYFKGSMRFDSSVPENEVRFSFDVSSGGRLEEQILDFIDNFLFVSSTDGTSRVIFDDNIQIYNNGTNSFVLGKGAVLEGGYIMVKTNPIKQTSAAVRIGRDVILATDQYNAIDVGSAAARSLFAENIDVARQILGNVSQDLDDGLTRGEYNVPAGTIVYGHTVQLGRASGNINLEDGAKATQFGVHPTNELDIALVNGATIEQGSSSVTFKSTDSITVRGENNSLKVAGDIGFGGQLSLAAGAELDIIFDPSSTSATLTFLGTSAVTLGANAELSIIGKGRVVIADGVEIDLGTSGRLTIGSSGQLTVEENAEVVIKGDGEVVCEDGGTILLDSVSSLIFGWLNTDDLALVCRRGGGVHVSAVDAVSGDARLSFAVGGHQISIIESGFFYIGENGVVDIAISSVSPSAGSSGDPATGFLELMEIGSNGFLLLDTGGRLVFSENWIRSGSSQTCWWDSLSGWIRGSGIIEFAEPIHGLTVFKGKLYASKDAVYFKNETSSLQNIAENLVQRDSTLQSVVCFTDENGNNAVLTGDKKVAVLPSNEQFSNEILTGENEGGFVTYDSITRTDVTYGSDGLPITP